MGDMSGMSGMSAGMTQQINKSVILDAPFEVCPKCGGKFFREVHAFKRISKLVVGTSEDAQIPIPIYVCDKCGAIATFILEDKDMKRMLTEENEDDKQLELFK